MSCFILQGMCCAFNFEAAEDIFVESKYTRVVTKLRKEDAAGAFENSTLPGCLDIKFCSEIKH
jgi:hypothetical protein